LTHPTDATREDIVEEGRRLARAAVAERLPLRLLGGVAVRLAAPDELPAALVRPYGDLDWIVARRRSPAAQRFFAARGYRADARFNAMRGRERLLFLDETRGRRVDVFVGGFRMCHELPLNGGIDPGELTVPPAWLLLTKLQVVELNDKDARDVIALLYGDGVDAGYVARLCAADWGLWRTSTANLAICAERVPLYAIGADAETRVTARLRAIEAAIAGEPKTRRWTLRARVGERRRWYDLPEEHG
jgi:hypothetical protein